MPPGPSLQPQNAPKANRGPASPKRSNDAPTIDGATSCQVLVKNAPQGPRSARSSRALETGLKELKEKGLEVWLGDRESLGLLHESPMKTGPFRLSVWYQATWRLRVLSSAHVSSRPFSSFAGAMSLDMSLAATTIRGSLVEDQRLHPRGTALPKPLRNRIRLRPSAPAEGRGMLTCPQRQDTDSACVLVHAHERALP
jgi:hypothetical protein